MSITWRPEARYVNGEQIAADLVSAMTEPVGTDFPFGCRWCGRSTKNDTVEVCEQLNGVVHADCHESECDDGRCSDVTCTDERCDFRFECENCFATRCTFHRGVLCDC